MGHLPTNVLPLFVDREAKRKERARLQAENEKQKFKDLKGEGPLKKGKGKKKKDEKPKTLEQKIAERLQDEKDEKDDEPGFDPRGVSVTTGKHITGWI